MRPRTPPRVAAGLSFLSILFAAAFGPLSAQTAAVASGSGATIVGTVVDRIGGLPVNGAAVELDQNVNKLATTVTDRNGQYSFTGQRTGFYAISVSANGYQPARSDLLTVLAGQIVQVRLALARAQVSGGGLREIGRVSASGSHATLQTTTTILRDVTPELLQRENYLRVGEALNGLPGVDVHNQSSAVGDDLYVDIRGLKQSESQVLLDGHPIGPIGVTSTQSGRYDAYDFQDAPLFALQNVQVTFGSGGLGLYGTDSVAGTIDMQTLNPTRNRELTVKQGVGDQGRLFSAFQTTGTHDKLGYALVHGVQGTYGDFPTQDITQTGVRSNGDFTSATQKGITYPVSGDYLLRSDLLKLRYDFSNSTSLTLTGFSATSRDDKTGNGDNDFVTYDNALLTAQGKMGSAGCASNLVPAMFDNNSSACISPQEFARLASGPAGGGPDAYQTLRSQDYHARLVTNPARNHQLTLDGFISSYALDYTRQPSFIQGPLFLQSRYFRTNGVLVSDDITSGAVNDLGFGYYTQQYRIRGGQTSQDGLAFISSPDATRYNNNYFIRDVFSPISKLSFYFNGWYRVTSLQNANSFDPRLSIVVRPTSNDVFRLTGGKSDGEPAPQFGALTLTAAGALTPNCAQVGLPGIGKQFTVGSVPNPGLTPEVASDLEFAYGHRFFGDTSINAVLYDTQERDRIASFAVPSGPFLNQFNPAPFLAAINAACGAGTITNPATQLLVNTSLNAARARARGIEISGRARAARNLFFDFAYDVQQVNLFDVPNAVLINNANIINGAQLVEIPMHKASLGVDYRNMHGGEVRLDGYYVGVNNALNRPGYTFFNAAFTQELGSTTSLNLGFQNIFNSQADNYGRIGWGIFRPENQFGTNNGDPIAQGSERFGLVPMTFTLSLTRRVGY